MEKPKLPKKCSIGSDPVVCDHCQYPYQKELAHYEEERDKLITEMHAENLRLHSFIDEHIIKNNFLETETRSLRDKLDQISNIIG